MNYLKRIQPLTWVVLAVAAVLTFSSFQLPEGDLVRQAATVLSILMLAAAGWMLARDVQQ